MKDITRSKDRVKATGEIFTPLPLVDEILSKLPDDVWLPEKTFIDPACGDGNFLVRVIVWKIWLGSTAEQALSTTYGVDLMPDNIAHCRARLLTHAFAAESYKHVNDELLLHLTPEEERAIGMAKGHDPFAQMYNALVERNIVCHDALTYDYSFNEKDGVADMSVLDRLGIDH